ncbi:GNAT family N-acetyltransferase [Pararhizobium haloflavum]|uniref:GNAT family N-acetyltransferase n=1 Tax=Pararhizobium haloflavum TaxID=2037914 RepID=UPI000C17C9A7|nr:GNAT family N-acetyltransferase [Pararhizobium haloflavum]
MAIAATDFSENQDDRRSAGAVAIAVHRGLAAALPEWRRLEDELVMTPYQRPGWVASHTRANGLSPDDIVLVTMAADGRTIGALPLMLERRYGVTIARMPTSAIANSDFPMLSAEGAHAMTPAVVRAALKAAADAVGGLDVAFFTNQPGAWQGIANPLLRLPHHPSPDPFYFGAIGPEMERPNAKRIRNIRRGCRRLEEAHGAVELRRAASRADVEAFHAAFLEQRGARFRQQGIRNIFAEPGFVAFFKDAAIRSLGDERPTLSMHALTAGEDILAVSFGTYSGTHFSQYINSISSGPASRYSLMGILMLSLIEALSASGIKTIDMGIGEFDYKNDWTDRTTGYDGAIALTPAGRLAAAVLMGERGSKRLIKQNPRLWRWAKTVRGFVTRNHERRTARLIAVETPQTSYETDGMTTSGEARSA